MIPYDLKVRDIDYYWSGSLLLWLYRGSYLPVTVRIMGDDGDQQPLQIRRYDTGEALAMMSIDTFIEQCLVHFPAMGYADLDGVPVYVSPRAGQHRTKAIDQNNVTMVVPINLKQAASHALKELTTKYRKALMKDPMAPMSKPDQRKRALYNKLLVRGRPERTGRIVRASNDTLTMLPRLETVYEHRIVSQAVNKKYMTIPNALAYISKDPSVVGVAISTNCCIIRDMDRRLRLYYRTSPIGQVITATTVRLSPTISMPARRVLSTLIPFTNIK